MREWSSLNTSMRTTATTKDPSLPTGAYTTNFGKINKLPGLNEGAPYSAAIVWPTSQSSDEKFPILTFAHGTGVGSTNPESAIAYHEVLKFVASFGFIIVAPDSCPAIECAGYFAHDQLTALKAVTENPGLHPSLASADFNRTGVFGHSMGGISSVVADGGSAAKLYKPADYNVKAAVSMHPCRDSVIQAAGAEMPILFTTGSSDSICGSACSDTFYSQVQHPAKALFNIAGASHFEPTYLGDASEKYAIAYWFACHIKGEQCDRVYGPSGQALCDQVPSGHSLAECKMEGGPGPVRISPAKSQIDLMV
jgi:hypothetical protein